MIYLFGAAWYAVWFVFTAGAAGPLGRSLGPRSLGEGGLLLPQILAQSVFPFVLIDAAKAALAAAAAPGVRRLLPVG